MKKALIIPLLFVAFTLSAAPIGERKAREIATTFFANSSTRATSPVLSLEWAGENISGMNIAPLSASNSDEAVLYIYNREDAKGFVVVAGDDNVEKQIVAFSHDNTMRVNNLSDGAKYILSAWCKQIASARVGAKIATRADASDVGTVQKLYSTALWNQGAPFNNEAPIIDGMRAVTGCVATAMSIICYHNKYPEYGVGTTPAYSYTTYGASYQVPSNSLGRRYDYSKMRSDNYESGYSFMEAAAVAALMKDMGTAVQMMYHYNASGAYDMNVPVALSTYFGYTKAAQLTYADSYSEREWAKLLKENVATYGPTYFSGQSGEGGHAFVIDGYTNENYFHINYGWGGVDNGYFLIPRVEYAYDQVALFGLEPDKSGTSTYKDNLLLMRYNDQEGLVSGTEKYETGKSFNMKAGAIWNAGNVTFSGKVQIALCDKDGAIKETLYTASLNNLGVYYLTWIETSVAIWSQIAAGDRIRLMYKGQYSDGWQWARRYEQSVTDEIIVSATEEDIARSLGFKYDKQNKRIILTSTYQLTYKVLDSFNRTKASGTISPSGEATISVSGWSVGEYRISVSKDSSVYNLTIVL